MLIVQSTGHAVHVFVNGQLTGTYICSLTCFLPRMYKSTSPINRIDKMLMIPSLQVPRLGQGKIGDSHLKERSTYVLDRTELHY